MSQEQIETTGFDFAYALQNLKDGKKVCRSQWFEVGQYVFLVSAAETFSLVHNEGNVEDWSPSGADLLANDWSVVE